MAGSGIFTKINRNKRVIARKTNNTFKQINSVAAPALTAASIVAPEFAPVFGAVGAGLKAGEAGSALARKHFR
jgi:hypothetical protein